MRMRSFVYIRARVAAIGTILLAPAVAGAADIVVPAGGNLQAALNAAQPGDTILLAAGATYTGNFTLPVHGGTSYITIRTGGSSTQLPAAGERITPADAPYLAKIRSPDTSPALTAGPSAAYWRLMLLEFLGNQDGAGDIVALGNGSIAQNSLSLVPHHLTLDRVYIHGDALIGQKRGILLNSGNTTIINSHVADIKTLGQDSQAIAGANGPGPFHIENNHLVASTQMFIIGGDDPKIPGLVPADLTFRGNTLTRPLSWRNAIVPTPGGLSANGGTGGSLAAGSYAYRVVARRPVAGSPAPMPMATSARSGEVTATVGAGGRVTITWSAVQHAAEYRVYGRTPGGQTMFWTVQATSFTDTGEDGTAGTAPSNGSVWQVKNLFELKNLRRAQVDFNLMENNWLQAQSGIAVLLTVRNQNGGCTQCVVEDVTFEYNVVRNMGGGFTILGEDYNHPSQLTNNIRIRHNEFSGLDRSLWGGNGYFLNLSEGPRDVTVEHNTIISPNGLGVVSATGPPILGFVFRNNVARHNSYGISGSGQGYGNTAISHYFPDAEVRRNVLAGGSASRYPADNLFPTTTAFQAHFVDYAGGDYALVPGTDWADHGTDGTDLGADYVTLRAGVGSTPGPPTVLTVSLPETTQHAPYSATLDASGGREPYAWSISAGSLPAGIALNAGTGTLSGAASVAGSFNFTVRVTDANGATDTQALTIQVDPAPTNSPPTVSLRASASGVIQAGTPVTLTADAADADGTVTRVNFFVNGQAAGSDTSAPFTLNWVAQAGGPFAFRATAVDDDLASTTSATLTLRTTAEIVVYAGDLLRMVGDFQLVSDAAAAGGQRLWNPNRNVAKISTASATPVNYAEFRFYAQAGRPYHFWMRGLAQSNNYNNDSFHVQFSSAVTATGAATYRIGTTSSTGYVLEDTGGAHVSGWGWQDNAYAAFAPPIYFGTTGLQTIRLQQREDGLSIDQIVISPVQYFALSPGLLIADTTIVPKP